MNALLSRAVLLPLGLSLLALPAAAQDWTVIPLGTAQDLQDIHRDGFNILWVVGDNGYASKSDAAHTTYTPVNVGTTADLTSFDSASSISHKTGAAAGTFQFSGNGGASWVSRPIPDASQSYFISDAGSSTALAAGSAGALYRTSNSGVDWTVQSTPVTVPLHGAIGETLVVGDDGVVLAVVSGTTWEQRPSNTTADLYAASSTANGTQTYVGERGAVLRRNASDVYGLRPSGTTATLRDVTTSGADANRVIAVGDRGTALKSTDAGATWCRMNTGTTADLLGVTAPNSSEYVIVGEGGLMIRTTNGGGPCSTVAEVEAGIDPVNPPLIVPGSGGPVQFTATLTNTTAAAKTFAAWVDVVLPDGSVFGPIEGPVQVTLGAGGSVGPVTITKQVPGAAPPGTYTLRLRTGTFGVSLVDEATTTFTKGADPRDGGAAAAMTPADWQAVGTASLSGAAPLARASASSRPALTGPTLAAPVPNPLRGATTLHFALLEAGPVRLTVYDALGRTVAVLADGVLEAGEHEAAFDAGALPSGTYLVRLEAGGGVLTQRLMLVR